MLEQRVCDVPWRHLLTEGFHKLIWPQIEPMLAKSLAMDELRRYTTQDVLQQIMVGKARLWVSYDREAEKFEMAAVTEILQSPQCRECRVWLIGGTNMKAWLRELDHMIDGYARSEFCSHVTSSGRPGWARAVKNGWRPAGVDFIKTL